MRRSTCKVYKGKRGASDERCFIGGGGGGFPMALEHGDVVWLPIEDRSGTCRFENVASVAYGCQFDNKISPSFPN